MHQRHVAAAMARALIGREQAELLGGGAGADEPGAQILIDVADAPGRPGMSKALDRDPHRHAGGAAAAHRPIGEAVAAPKPGTRQIVIEKGTATAREVDDELALCTARDIGASDRRSGKKLASSQKERPLRIHASVALRGLAFRPAFRLWQDLHHTVPLRAAVSLRRSTEVWTRVYRGARGGALAIARWRFTGGVSAHGVSAHGVSA